MTSSTLAPPSQGGPPTGAITEDEASLYDRQIRLWGLEAQNRMRSSTILILTLRSLAQETIKNLVLAGVGRLIVMDEASVSAEDFGAGLLFREGGGDEGKKRVEAALPQIQSLNPLVQVTPIPTLYPFSIPSTSTEEIPTSALRSTIAHEPTANGSGNGMEVDDGDDVEQRGKAMDEFLKREKVDLVCVTDMSRKDIIAINESCRRTGNLFYSSGSYGFVGYIANDLGEKYEWVQPQTISTASTTTTKMLKKIVSYPTLSKALTSNPFKGLTRNSTKEKNPGLFIGILAVWEYQARHGGKLPSSEDAEEEVGEIAEGLRKGLEVNEKALKEMPKELISHLSSLSNHEFAPTSAILGGLLAQDILKALSRKEKPVMNFLSLDSMAGVGVVTKWGVGEEMDA